MNFSRSIYVNEQPDDLRDRPVGPLVPQRRQHRRLGQPRRQLPRRPRHFTIRVHQLRRLQRHLGPRAAATSRPACPTPMTHPTVPADRRQRQRHVQLPASRTRSPPSPTARATRSSFGEKANGKFARPANARPQQLALVGRLGDRATRSARPCTRSTRSTRSDCSTSNGEYSDDLGRAGVELPPRRCQLRLRRRLGPVPQGNDQTPGPSPRHRSTTPSAITDTNGVYTMNTARHPDRRLPGALDPRRRRGHQRRQLLIAAVARCDSSPLDPRPRGSQPGPSGPLAESRRPTPGDFRSSSTPGPWRSGNTLAAGGVNRPLAC